MSIGFRRPLEAVDLAGLVAAFPPPPEYFESAWLDTPETIERKQLSRLKDHLLAAERVPFFRRRWKEAGFDARALCSLEELRHVPAYTVDDIRRSIEASPPWGDYQGVVPEDARREPMRIYMSGGTTGTARPIFFTQWDREVGAILMARGLYMLGIRPGDVVINAWAYSTHNAAHMYDEALYRWLNCVVLTTSTGNVTSSERQLELAMQYGAKSILTTGDYIMHLADVARKLGHDPKKDFSFRALPSLFRSEEIESTFGAEALGFYGNHEVQKIAVECPARKGLHIFEDAFIVQIVDPETGAELPEGEFGAICVTELYKSGGPQIRYNVLDLSRLLPRERCACGSWLRRLEPFSGRGDNMVKLRGVNIWPEAVGEVALAVPGAGTDWFVKAVRENNRDELIVYVVSERDRSAFVAIAAAIEKALKEKFGVRIRAEVVAPGALDAWTGFNQAAKLRRFLDERN